MTPSSPEPAFASSFASSSFPSALEQRRAARRCRSAPRLRPPRAALLVVALVGVLAACAGAPTSDTASGADPAAVPASGDPAAPAGMLVDRAAEGGETAGETELDAALARVLEAEGLSIRIEASGAGETLAETIEFSRTGAGARAEIVEQLGDATPTRAVVVEDAEAIELVAGQLEAWRHLASAFTLAETEPGVWRSVGPELAGAAEAEIRLQDGFPRRVVMTVSDGGSPVVVLWTIERRG